MNEIRDLIVGIDFGKEYSQICYYDRKGDEARSLSMKAGGNQYEAPCILCWRPEQKDYCVGLEADYFVREKGGVMIDDVYGICEKSDSVLVEGQELALLSRSQTSSSHTVPGEDTSSPVKTLLSFYPVCVQRASD